MVIIAARNEADRIGATLDAIAGSLPGAHLVVADDASGDGTSDVAVDHGAEVISRGRPRGKGANMTAACDAAMRFAAQDPPPIFMVCDGDLGSSAAALRPLVDAVRSGDCDLSVAVFARRVGGGFGVALRFARWVIQKRCGFVATAPISGQRAMSAEVFRQVVPFAGGYGMEIGMTVDAIRAGFRVREYELDLEHRATGRSLGGFIHRGRQFRDFTRVYIARRR